MTDEATGPPPGAATFAIRSPFRIEEVLGASVKTFFANLLPFLMIAAVFELPSLGLSSYATLRALPGKPPNPLLILLSTLIAAVTHNMIVGSLTFGVFRHLRGQPIGWGECVRRGFTRFPTALLCSILVGLAMLLGYVLCFIPGIYVLVVYAVAVPAAVVEGHGALAGMERSKQLTLGHRWPVFGALFLVGVVVVVPFFVATILRSGAGSSATSVAITCVWSVVTVAFQAVLSCVIYYKLRATREDLDAPELAAVFD